MTESLWGNQHETLSLCCCGNELKMFNISRFQDFDDSAVCFCAALICWCLKHFCIQIQLHTWLKTVMADIYVKLLWDSCRVSAVESIQQEHCLHLQPSPVPFICMQLMASVSIAGGAFYQFKTSLITDHGNMLHRYENGPFHSQKNMAKTFCPCSSSFWCKCEAALQVRMGGGGDRGKCNWGISLWGPTQIPNVLRAENKNSMGAAPATLAPSIEAPSATQKHWGLFKNIPPPHAGQNLHCQQLQPSPFQALIKPLVVLFDSLVEWWRDSPCQSKENWRPLGALWLAPSSVWSQCTWWHVAGIRTFHCGLKSFQRLHGHTLKERSVKFQRRSSEHFGPMVALTAGTYKTFFLQNWEWTDDSFIRL